MEKEKLKNAPPRLSWMHHRWFAYYMGIMFFIGGMVYVLDTAFVTFLFKPYGVIFPYAALGVPASIPALFFYDFIHPGTFSPRIIYFVPAFQDILIDGFILFCMSIVVVGVLRRLQRFRRVFKLLVYMNFALHVVFVVGMALTAIKQAIVPVSPSEEAVLNATHHSMCDYTISENIRIHADAYQWYQSGSDSYWEQNHSRYSVSTDGGKIWHEFMILFSRCDLLSVSFKTGYFDDRFFWLWTDSWIVFTHDGGYTWQSRYTFQSDFPLRVSGNIQSISFETPQTGQMVIANAQYDSNNRRTMVEQVVTTTDGGMTWQLPDSEAAKLKN
jgi:hypothetical protein